MGKTESALPPEIVAAEADYEARQRILEAGLSRSRLECLSIDPEVRRKAMTEWMDSHREELERQQAYSNAIDKMRRDCGLDAVSSVEQSLAARAPQSPGKLAGPEGKRWALHEEVTRLRERHAHDPEAARDALGAWLAENAAAVEEAVKASNVSRKSTVESLAMKPRRLPRVLEIPPEASEKARQLLVMRHDLELRLSAIPRPVMTPGKTPTDTEMEEWRNQTAAAVAVSQEEINHLHAEMVTESLLQELELFKTWNAENHQ